MKKEKVKNVLDYIPFIILTVAALFLIWTVATTNIRLHWKHIAGLCFLTMVGLAFWHQHKIGVLTLGISLILGLFGLLSYSPAISTITMTIGKPGDSQIPVFYGQTIFLLWLLLHFIVSGRHYVGILTKKYWSALFAVKIN